MLREGGKIVRALCKFLGIGSVLFFLSSVVCLAQNAGNLLASVYGGFSGGQAIQKVQLSGTAQWYAGSAQDSGECRAFRLL